MNSTLFRSLDSEQQREYLREQIARIQAALDRDLAALSAGTGVKAEVTVSWEGIDYEDGTTSYKPIVEVEVEHTSLQTVSIGVGKF